MVVMAPWLRSMGEVSIQPLASTDTSTSTSCLCPLRHVLQRCATGRIAPERVGVHRGLVVCPVGVARKTSM